MIKNMQNKLNKTLNWKKPQTDEEWAEDVKRESLHLKFDYQLDEMEISHQDKLPRVEKDLYWLTKYPDVKRKEIEEKIDNVPNFDLEGMTKEQFIESKLQEELAYYNWKVDKLNQSIERIKKEIELRTKKIVIREPIGTDYYCDPSLEPATIAGTWEFTNGSANITTGASADGNAIAEVAIGDWIKLSDGLQWYKIKTITDDDNLILDTLFQEATHTDDTNATVLSQPDVEDGSTMAKAWPVLTIFTENGRAGGDKLTVRRGRTELISEGGSDLLFNSNGTITNPIVIEADYDDTWSDFVDLSGTGTATLTFGSKTVTFSADVSGVLAAHDWIYVSGDAARDFAYEVASVSTVTVTLYLPYKGAQAGSGKTVYNMQDAPIWNIAAGNYQWAFDADKFWKVQGLHVRGTDVNSVIEMDSCYGHLLKDLIVESNGTSDYSFWVSSDQTFARIYKTRCYNYGYAFRASQGMYSIGVYDSLFDTGKGVIYIWDNVIGPKFIDCEFSNHSIADFDVTTDTYAVGKYIYFRNCLFGSAVELEHFNAPFLEFYSEDHDQVVGDNRQLTGFSVAEGTPSIQSETGTVRGGGGSTSIKVTPSDKLAASWELSKIKLFEYPVYAVKDVEKTYTVYFKSSGTGNWTADPLATELWIEAEYWGHATNNHRKITKSTGVCDFNGDDTNWLTLTVTVQPAQTGVLYLRGYYCKTKEDGKSNIFYVDTKPVIS